MNPRQLNNETSELNPRQPNNDRPVVSGGTGGPMTPPDFGRSFNPISTNGDRLCPPNNTGTPGFSDLPTALNETPELNERQEETSNLRFTPPPPYPCPFPPPPYPPYQKTLAVTTLRSGHIAPIKLPDQPLDLSKVVIDKEKYFKSIPFIPLTDLDKRRTRICDFPGCAKGYTKGSHLKAHQRLHTGKLFTYLCFVHPIFRFWFLVTFGDEVTKI